MDYVRWIRPKIGHEKIFLPCANGVIFNQAGQVLLMRRRDFGSWATPGGAVDVGETVAACLRREVAEETGLQLDNIELVSILSEPQYDVVYPNGDQTQQFTVNFRAIASTGILHPHDGEALELAWFDPHNLPLDNMLPWYPIMIAQALRDDLPLLSPPQSLPKSETYELWLKLRQFVGHDLIMTCGAVVAVTRDDGCILMTKRMDDGRWWFPAGGQMIGENVSRAAVREVREETGITIVPDRLLGILSGKRYQSTHANGDKNQYVSAAIRAHFVSGTLEPDMTEISALKWMTPEEVLEATKGYRFHPLAQQIITHLNSGNFFE